MCTQCVAQAVPAVAVAAGGLRAMAWQAKHRRRTRGLPSIPGTGATPDVDGAGDGPAAEAVTTSA